MSEHRFHLPQLTAVSSSPAVPETTGLLVSGGRPPEPHWLQEAANGRRLIAVDHGLDACQRAGLRPACLIGDGDSATPAAWQQAQDTGTPIYAFPPEKDDTDTQLALTIAHEQGMPAALLTGVFGGRFDHACSTIFSCAAAPLRCVLADECEALFYLKDGEDITITCHACPTAISLLPLTPLAEGVTITGVHWPLQDATLPQLLPRAVSNVLEPPQDTFHVSLQKGILGVYLVWGKG